MTPERYTRVCELFDQAEALGPPERQQFLDQACAEDTSLRVEVDRMLAHAGTAGEELLPPLPFSLNRTGPWSTGASPSTLVGRRIGPYQIQRLIGTGGMGTVYLAARVDDFQHQVALKVIKSGHESTELVERFRTERQVLASLNHPHIARIFDGGTTDDGQPYFVMEYIDGLAIDRYCDAHHLPTPERLRLLRSVCAGVHYAHQHTVIHRDLKPGNVLVTADGTPKVVDFGLAKHLESDPNQPQGSEPTPPGAIVGTPSYIAPEQASSVARNRPLGPAADVYSLGAILYELLTGQPPFRADTPLETLMMVLNDEPVPPSRLHPKLARDLETICLKCLQKDPVKRYASAETLADDLGRFLNGEPIQARPVGRIERGWRWCRRYPVVAGLTALAASLLVAVTIVSVVFAVQKTNDVARLERLSGELEQQGRRNLRLQEQKTKLEAQKAKQYQAVLDDSFKLLGILLVNDLDRKPQHGDLVTQERVRNLKRLFDQLTVPAMIDSLQKKLATLESLSPANPDVAQRQRVLANICQALGVQAKDDGRRAEAKLLLERAVTAWEHVRRQAPQDAEALNELANSLYYLGALSRDAGDPDRQKRLWTRAVAISEKIAQKNPDYAANLGRSYYNLGVAAAHGKRPDEVIDWQTRAIDTLTPLHRRAPMDEKITWFLR
jgi:serine/threonine protein kinase